MNVSIVASVGTKKRFLLYVLRPSGSSRKKERPKDIQQKALVLPRFAFGLPGPRHEVKLSVNYTTKRPSPTHEKRFTLK
ncbi:MAG: hypothetical protein VW907_08625, partial [Opitutae bacterium]